MMKLRINCAARFNHAASHFIRAIFFGLFVSPAMPYHLTPQKLVRIHTQSYQSHAAPSINSSNIGKCRGNT
jgi:hypothetical protein